MDRRRLVLATYLAEGARPLTVVICVAIFVAVFGLVSLASQVLQAGVRSPFVWLLTGVFVVPYAVKVAQIFRALRPPSLKSRGVRVERAGAERFYALVIGLALLDAVSPRELRALVATAVARAFTGDRITARAYRTAIRWIAMLTPDLADPYAGGANVAAVVAAGCLRALNAQHVVESREQHARKEAGRIASPADVSAGLV